MSTHVRPSGWVYDGRRCLGVVQRVDYPHSRHGRVWTETVWEARPVHDAATVSGVGTWPCFPTREQAAEWLVRR